jgi:hypothetical protein
VIEVAVDGNCPEADVEGMLKVDVAWISVSGREISRRGERAIEFRPFLLGRNNVRKSGNPSGVCCE